MPISSADTSQAPPAPAATAALGTYAKSITPPPKKRRNRGGRGPVRESRARRYELQETACSVLSAEGTRQGLRYGHDLHRTAKCKRIRRGEVSVHLAREQGAAFYSGLITCGSVWACPVCAAVVQERRREEIARAIDWAYEHGLQPMMVTLTHPHTRADDLGDLLRRQAMALQRLRAGAPWGRVKAQLGYQGLIRALELTHGENGWHPHTHEIWLVSAQATAEDAREKITTRWISACERAGLLPPEKIEAFKEHAVDVKSWVSTGEYLAKIDDESQLWGADREMASASSKKGRAGGRAPFQILADACEGDAASAALYVDYALTMRGRRQLFWSRGLKARVGIEDIEDEELAEQSREAADLLGQLTADEWGVIRRAGQRAQVLDAAETGGWEAIQVLIAALAVSDPVEQSSGAASGSGAVPAVAEPPSSVPRLVLVVPRPAGPPSAPGQIGLFGQPHQPPGPAP